MFSGSSLNVMEAVYQVIYGYLKFNLPQSSLSYYLKVIQEMLPEDNDLPTSVRNLIRRKN